MIKEEKPYGIAMISHFLPTVPALRYLNCCSMAGWHECNRSYHMRYPKGVSVVFIIYTIKGSGRIRSGEECWELNEGDIVVIPPDTPMEYMTASKDHSQSWEFYWLNLEGDYVKQTAKKLREDGYIVHACRNTDAFAGIFRWLLESPVLDHVRESEQSLKIQDLFQQLTSELLFENRGHSSSDNVAESILTYIQKNYSAIITLEELSHRFFLSKNQIIRVFRKRTGYTPYEYIKQYRLTKACELLVGTSLQVSEIGARVGYSNNSHFAAQFRGLYGMTPSEYRDRLSPEM